jgi:hypothetical protein
MFRGAPPRRRPVAARPAVDGLEDRKLLTVDPGKIVVTATPRFLTPPNGQYVPVTVSGSFTITDPAVAKGFIYVTDQYGKDEPFGPLPLQRSPTDPHLATFSVVIHLQAQRGSMTSNGRQYDILVGAKDAAGAAGKTIAVNVPKDPAAIHPHAAHVHAKK